MPASNDIKARKEEIHDLIADGDIRQGVKRVLDFARNFSDENEHINEAVAISADFNLLRDTERKRTLVFDEFRRQRTMLISQILDFIDRVIEDVAEGLPA